MKARSVSSAQRPASISSAHLLHAAQPPMLSCWKTEVWNRGTTKFLQGYIWVVGRSEQKSHISRPGNGEMLRISVKFALQYKVTARQDFTSPAASPKRVLPGTSRLARQLRLALPT